ncbi:response regulator transcription factor [Fusibacter sp. JL216-2]|uniref:response regulator transcription factor n=1 Tax=Fusibacter sp. JL216-2 TaxID=3071453 RepID=UPI003D32FA5E
MKNGEKMYQLDKLIEEKTYDRAVEFIMSEFSALIDSYERQRLYKLIDQIPDTCLSSAKICLIIGLVAYYAGDNDKVNSMLLKAQVIGIESSDEAVLKQAVMCISMVTKTIKERVEVAQKGIGLIDEETDRAISGHIYMFYAHVLSALPDFARSQTAYHKAIDDFSQKKMRFKATLATLNYNILLNTRGDHHQVIWNCSEFINKSGSVHGQSNQYLFIVESVLGAAYILTGKTALATSLLENALVKAYNLEFVHMYGFIVNWLFEAYLQQGRENEIVHMLRKYVTSTKPLGDMWIQLMYHQKQARYALHYNKKPQQKDVEALEICYEMQKENSCIYLIQIMTELTLKEHSRLASPLVIEKKLEQYKYKGLKSDCILLNLLLAMWYDASGATEKALPYFNEAVALSIDCHSVYYLNMYMDLTKKYKKHLKQNQMNSLNEMGLEIKTVKDQWESNAFDLTSREFEVLALLNDGLSNKSISEKLFISVGTTKWHLNNIYGKLGVGRRTEALTFARDQGLF